MAADLAIVGTGPAGLAAGLLAGRFEYETVLFERSSLGGELENRHSIETYPGFPEGIDGPDLRERMVSQVRGLGLELELSEVLSITPGAPMEVSTRHETYDCSAVIVATGARSWRLDCPGAAEFAGGGVFYCGKCDGPLYADRTVAVYGGGERAVADSLFLSDIATEVLLIAADSALSAPPTLRELAMESPNIDIRRETKITEVVGDDTVSGLVLSEKESPNTYHERLDGLLVRNGLVPNSDFLDGVVERNENGEIVVDETMESSAPGLFAAGSVREGSPQYVASAVGDGMSAFHGTRAYL